MILFLENGRLGNQLFQYAALKTLFPKERAVIFGCRDLFDLFDGIDAVSCGRSQFTLRFAQYVTDEFFLLRLGGHSREVRFGDSAEVTAPLAHKRGLIRSVCRLSGFFQGERWFSGTIMERLTLKRPLDDAAKALISREAGSRTPCFVHIRLGDYLSWPSPEAPAVLPASWYLTCIAELRRRHADPCFIVLSDDLASARQMLGHLADACFLPADAKEAFAIMANCQGGVLSASSFSWWAAYFAHRKHAGGAFLAPLHWLGFRTCEWLPSTDIRSTFLDYVSVDLQK